jgi:hypothetical protein
MKGVEMSDIDWRGIALAINQLSQIAEPSRMDLMKQEEVIRANREKKDRAFETAKFQFETMFEQNKDLEKRIGDKEVEIQEINADANHLFEKSPALTSGNFYDVINSLDLNNMESLQDASNQLNLRVQNQLQHLGKISNIHSNMLLGKQLRETEGSIKSLYKDSEGNNVKLNPDYDENMDGSFKWINEQGVGVDESGVSKYNWDIDESGFVSEDELKSGLEETINWLEYNSGEDQNGNPVYDTEGIREGYWDGYEGTSERAESEYEFNTTVIDYENKLTNLIVDGQKIDKSTLKVMETEIQMMIEKGWNPELAEWMAINNLGDNDLIIMAQEYKNSAAEINLFHKGEGELYKYIEGLHNSWLDDPHYGTMGLIKGFEEAYGVPEGATDGIASINTTDIPPALLQAYKDAKKIYNQFAKKQTDMFATFLMEGKMHYIQDLDFEELESTGDSNWSNMKKLGFDKDFYNYLRDTDWISGDSERSKMLAFGLKEEFEWMYENADAYVNGKLRLSDRKKFDQLIINFHRTNPEYFQQKWDNFEELFPTIKDSLNEEEQKYLEQKILGST